MTAIDGREAAPRRALLQRLSACLPLRDGPGAMAAGAFAIRVMGAGVGYGLHVLLARILGTSEFGLWAAGWTALVIIGHPSTAGFSESVVRQFTGYVAQKDWARARAFLRVGFATTFVVAICVAGAALLLLRQLSWLAPAGLVAPLTIAAMVLPAFAAQDLVEGVARALGRPILAFAPIYLLRPILIALGMTTASLAFGAHDAQAAMICTGAGIVASLAVHAALLLRALPKPIRATPPLYETRPWIVGSAPLAFIYVLDQFGASADVMALAFTATPAETGSYFAAARVLSLVAFAPFAVTMVASRGFAVHHTLGEAAQLRAFVRRTTRWTFFASFALLGLVLLAGPLLLSMFGRDFVSATPALAVLSLGLVARALSGHAEELLVATGRQAINVRIVGVSCVIAIVGCFAAAPVFGPLGAAAAMVAATCVRALLFVVMAHRLTGLYTGVGLDVFGLAPKEPRG